MFCSNAEGPSDLNRLFFISALSSTLRGKENLCSDMGPILVAEFFNHVNGIRWTLKRILTIKNTRSVFKVICDWEDEEMDLQMIFKIFENITLLKELTNTIEDLWTTSDSHLWFIRWVIPKRLGRFVLANISRAFPFYQKLVISRMHIYVHLKNDRSA